MENQSVWRAKLALACYFALVGGILLGSFIVAFVLIGMYGLNVDYVDLPFPIALISLPINETIILGITLLFAKYRGAGLRELGLKKASLTVLVMVSVLAVPLLLLGAGISTGEEVIFGEDPMAKDVEMAVTPRDPFQLIAMIVCVREFADLVWLIGNWFNRLPGASIVPFVKNIFVVIRAIFFTPYDVGVTITIHSY